MRADRAGVNKAVWLIDRGAVGERDHGTDTGRRHEPSAHRIMPDGIEQHLVERCELLAHHAPHLSATARRWPPTQARYSLLPRRRSGQRGPVTPGTVGTSM